MQNGMDIKKLASEAVDYAAAELVADVKAANRIARDAASRGEIMKETVAAATKLISQAMPLIRALRALDAK